MKIATNTSDPTLARRDIARLGLEGNIVDLEVLGFSVVPDMLSAEVLERAKREILYATEKQTGTRVDVVSGEGHENWRLIPYLLPRDPVFQDILLHEKMLALVTYLIGDDCRLSSMTSHLKGVGRGGELALHTDTWMPSPLPRYSCVTTVNFALMDYTRSGGALAIVPGSHKRARNPTAAEAHLSGTTENKEAVPIEMTAGSMAIWHGNTWHGSYPRLIPGLRINLSLYFARPWMQVLERYGRSLPRDVIDRHGQNPRFRQLTGLDDVHPWMEEGPSYLDKKENRSLVDD